MYHLTLKSSNPKTGPIPVSTQSAKTCPDVCPFKGKGGGCYAEQYPLKGHWDLVTDGTRSIPFSEFIGKVKAIKAGQLWRYGQAGDLPGIGNNLDINQLNQLVAANGDSRGWCYTHKPLSTKEEKLAVKTANSNGFTINLSANSLEHADRLAELKIGPVAVVLHSSQITNTTTPGGNKVVICPATQRDNITCESCGLCAVSKRSCIVGFPAHGNGRKKINAKMN